MQLEILHPELPIVIEFDYFFKGKKEHNIIHMCLHQLPFHIALAKIMQAKNFKCYSDANKTPIEINL